MSRKFLIVLLSIMLVGILFIGCNLNSNQVDASSNRFVVTGNQYLSVSTFTDSKTGVEYAIVQECGHRYIDVVVLQNADGTPKVK